MRYKKRTPRRTSTRFKHHFDRSVDHDSKLILITWLSCKTILIAWLSCKMTLIAWFHFDPGRKRFYRRHVSDYPLSEAWNKSVKQLPLHEVNLFSVLRYFVFIGLITSDDLSSSKFGRMLLVGAIHFEDRYALAERGGGLVHCSCWPCMAAVAAGYRKGLSKCYHNWVTCWKATAQITNTIMGIWPVQTIFPWYSGLQDNIAIKPDAFCSAVWLIASRFCLTVNTRTG